MRLMIKIDVSKNSKNTVIAMLSSAIELDSCAEIWIKEKGEAIKTNETNERKLKQENIGDVLKRIGIPCHLLGYHYIQDAVRISISDSMKFSKFATIVYGDVASKNKTSPTRVERAIRHAIDVAFKCGDIDEIYKLFGSSYSKNRGKPTNKEFIAMITELIKEGDMEDEY